MAKPLCIVRQPVDPTAGSPRKRNMLRMSKTDALISRDLMTRWRHVSDMRCWRRVTPNLASWVNQQRSEHAYTIVYHIYPKASQCKACNCCEMQEITRSSNYSSLFLWFHIIIMHSPNTKPTRVPSIQSICLGKVVLERICLQYTVSGLWLSQIFFWVMLAKHVRTFVTGIRQSKQRTAMSYKDL